MAQSHQTHSKHTTQGLLPGCAVAWHAAVNGQTLAGIFRLMSGDTHMLCYHVMGDEKPTVERFPSIQQAQERAGIILSTRVCVSR